MKHGPRAGAFGASTEHRATRAANDAATGKVAVSLKSGAGNETRTRDPDLGKVVLYQLSYSRVAGAILRPADVAGNGRSNRRGA